MGVGVAMGVSCVISILTVRPHEQFRRQSGCYLFLLIPSLTHIPHLQSIVHLRRVILLFLIENRVRLELTHEIVAKFLS